MSTSTRRPSTSHATGFPSVAAFLLSETSQQQSVVQYKLTCIKKEHALPVNIVIQVLSTITELWSLASDVDAVACLFLAVMVEV
jgi:hypothetical protein